MTREEIDAAIALLEVLFRVGERVYAAIEAHGSLSDAEKEALKARVRAARAAATYEPRDV